MSARDVHSIAKSRPQGGKKNLRAIGDRSRMGLLEMWVSTQAVEMNIASGYD